MWAGESIIIHVMSMARMTGAPAHSVIKMEFAPGADMTEEKNQ